MIRHLLYIWKLKCDELKSITGLCFVVCLSLMAACGNDPVPTPPSPSPVPADSVPVLPPTPPATDDDSLTLEFAKGADISWCTQMESEGHRFYDWNNREAQECTVVMKSLGMNAIRLRSWVSPPGDYCGMDDLLEKARRAAGLGLDLMIDFHYSDSMATIDNQSKPTAWASHTYQELRHDVESYTSDVLNVLKENNIPVKWVQVGNETDEGLLWPEGGIQRHPDQYAGLLSSAIQAARGVFPEVSVVVHLSRSYDQQRCKRHLDVLRQYNVDYDLIGLSLYPSEAINQSFSFQNGSSVTMRSEEDAIAYTMQNMSYLCGIYNKNSLFVEVGVPVQFETRGTLLMTNIMMQARESGICEGVFYWEPESYDGWQGYDKGAFLSNGHPTQILNAFGM